jgi:hypothetical protein
MKFEAGCEEQGAELSPGRFLVHHAIIKETPSWLGERRAGGDDKAVFMLQ